MPPERVIGRMRAQRYGRIVNISSIAAIGTALPGNAFYAATKAEVAILTKRFAMELWPPKHHGERRGAWLCPDRHDTARTWCRRLAGYRGKLRRQGNDGPYWRTGRHRQCGRLLGLARVWLDHGTDANRGRWTNGLHRTCVVVVSASALDAWVCAPSILPEQTFRHVIFPREISHSSSTIRKSSKSEKASSSIFRLYRFWICFGPPVAYSICLGVYPWRINNPPGFSVWRIPVHFLGAHLAN